MTEYIRVLLNYLLTAVPHASPMPTPPHFFLFIETERVQRSSTFGYFPNILKLLKVLWQPREYATWISLQEKSCGFKARSDISWQSLAISTFQIYLLGQLLMTKHNEAFIAHPFLSSARLLWGFFCPSLPLSPFDFYRLGSLIKFLES